MINIKDLVNNRNKYIEGFSLKGLFLEKEIDLVIELQNKILKLITEESLIRTSLNKMSKEISIDRNNQELKENASSLSSQASEMKKEIFEMKTQMIAIASLFPQLPSSKVIKGKNEDDNIVLEEFGKINSFNTLPHWEIMEKKNMSLDKESSKISGARHIFYNDKASKLMKAVERLMLEEHTASGYRFVEPSVIVNEEALYNTGQLPKFEEDLYKLENGQYLIPTAEVPLTNLAANKIYSNEELPIKVVGATSCFRKEAGSAGRDTRGLTRLHQFRKVELVKFGNPKDEENDFDEMLSQATKILNILEIPQRHLLLCTGDMSFGSRKTIDIEVWMPGQKRWVEISSVSSIGDFQSRRMNAKVKKDDNKEYLYTYNGSALAIGRTIAAIIENYYDPINDIIEIPKALHKYLDFKTI